MSRRGMLREFLSRVCYVSLTFWCRHLRMSGGLQPSISDGETCPPIPADGAGFIASGSPRGRMVDMRGIILAVLVAALFLGSPCAWGQIGLVQATTCGPGTFPGTSCTIQATGSGHLIVVGWSSAEGTAPTIGTITDNASNTYIEAPNARAVDSSFNMVDIWYAQNSNSGATSVTITPNPSGNGGAAVIWEFSGVATASPLDQVAVLNSQPVTSTPAGASVTTTSPVEAVVAVIAPQWWTDGLVNGNNFTQDFALNITGSPYYSSGWAHLITSSAGTYSAAWTTGADVYAATTASFKAASASYSACDLNQDGTVNILDVQVGTNMALAPTNCTAPYGQCNIALVQAVLTNAMGGPCVLPVVAVAPSSITFGNVSVGSSAAQTITLTGAGTSSTTISQATVSGAGFSISGPSIPLTLAVGQTATFTVTFTPSASGSATGSVTLVGNALNTPVTEGVSGAGVTAVSHSVSLSWTPSTTSGVASYSIYRITSSSTTAPATPYQSLASILATTCSGTLCTYTDTSVTAGTSYWYYAAAVNGGNVSAPSNIVQAVVPTP